MTKLVQVALCTSDMPRSIRAFVEVLGFLNAGGRPRWGAHVSRLQELPTGDDAHVMLWWLVGRQEFGGQIELFHHTSPPQRPRRDDWLPSDLGWTRFGIVVPDFDLTMRYLSQAGYVTMTEPMDSNGYRRVCFREPGADTIVEIMEEDPSLPAALAGSYSPQPALSYAAVSVSDLDRARIYFGEVFGFTEIEPDAIHRPEHEKLWGLEGAQSGCAVFMAGDVLLEVVQYESPTPKEPAPDYLLSDQGMMNVAMGYRDRSEFINHVAAAESAGATRTTEIPEVSGSVYLRIVDGISVELFLVPVGLDASFGLVPEELAPPGNVFGAKISGAK
ncbi:hypothetical protein [Streptomyces violaceusniger]|uniref:hypothetical protein n=1 Tax=Streptomyces violaceusniger TaxID=68280 RepID=UPI0012373ED2|nr:hypothetical protein [Streptomyces violaceusniger]